jgi:hypothetical protein
VTPFLEAFYEAVRRWRLFCLVCLTVAVWLVGLYFWLSLPVATVWQLVAQGAGALALLAVPLILIHRIYRAAGGGPFRPHPALLLALPAAAFVGLWLPYRLLWWIPPLSSFAGQTTSLVLRFAAADLLFSFALLWVIAIAAQPYGKALPAAQR